jgi:hypothetical protein
VAAAAVARHRALAQALGGQDRDVAGEAARVLARQSMLGGFGDPDSEGSVVQAAVVAAVLAVYGVRAYRARKQRGDAA